MQTDGQMDGRADIRKLIVVIRYSANAPKIGHNRRLPYVLLRYIPILLYLGIPVVRDAFLSELRSGYVASCNRRKRDVKELVLL